MVKGKALWDRLSQDICTIILNSKTNLVFLIGDNSTGKSEIGELLKDKITVLDNYTGTFSDIPKDKRVLVITHRLNLLLQAPKNTNIIVTRRDNLYISCDCDITNCQNITNIMNNVNSLTVFLNNAVSGNWSSLNQEFLNEYIQSHKMTTADKLILNTIEQYKVAP